MKVVLQRVAEARVEVDATVVGSINQGLLLFLGIEQGDTQEQADWLAEKILNLRIFTNPEGKLNDKNIQDINGEVLVVSQFTLAASLQKGNRPDFTAAAAPQEAGELYKYFIQKMQSSSVTKVESGQFGAYMQVYLTNDGPFTLLLER